MYTNFLRILYMYVFLHRLSDTYFVISIKRDSFDIARKQETVQLSARDNTQK